VHGDAHTGNLLRTPSGRPVLCDLDSVSRGPAEVDLVPAAHAVARFGRDAAGYARLAGAYGFDVRDSPAWPHLRRLRDLQLAVYLLPQRPDGPAAVQLAHRLRTVLAGDDTAIWSRFPRMA
jgi:Ser/Thr protein kinase RdoA (MazF antagonist)